ncbi:MAG: ABC transporter ATP-binding protein [Pseudomonadota bacterium]
MSNLAVSDLEVARFGIPVVRGVSLIAQPGEVSVLLGSNGAGKTTLLEAISGVIPAQAGKIAVGTSTLTGKSSSLRARAGLAHVEQGRTVFGDMTVSENLEVARHHGASLQAAFDLFPELLPRCHVKAAMLSGGEQQMVVIARALVGQPSVIMIDEMSTGLAPVVFQRLIKAVRALADTGIAVVLVEQFAALALSIGDRSYVLRRGEMVYDGACDPLLQNPDKLHQLYLGDLPDKSGTDDEQLS